MKLFVFVCLIAFALGIAHHHSPGHHQHGHESHSGHHLGSAHHHHRVAKHHTAEASSEESVAERLANLLEERLGTLYCMYGVAYQYNTAYCMDKDEYEKKNKDAPVSGAVGSNRCNGKQMTWQQCKSYADAEYGFTWGRKATWPNYPKGCLKQLGNKKVYFNEHATGAGLADPPTKPVCVSSESEVGAVGTVTWFNADKGYGFIQPEAPGSRKLFVHHSEIQTGGRYAMLSEGEKVTYELGQGKRGDPEAKNVRLNVVPVDSETQLAGTFPFIG